MSTITDRIAQLSPEKRAKLLEKLTGKPMKPAAPSQTARPSNAHRDWDNFCYSIGTPGNFDSIRFRQIERIPPGPGQIQVKAKAFALNFRDLMIAMNMYPATPGVPSIMGSDYAAEVLAVGEGVTEFKPGDGVIALSAGSLTPEGGVMADSHFCAISNISARQAVHKARNLSYEQAAGIPTVYLTSYYALQHVARVQPGERVLIHTATGGVGLSALQVAKWLGAEIYATAGSPKKRELLESMGVSNPMDSRSLLFADRILELTDGEGVDVILNTLPGEAAEKGLDILRDFGRFLQIDKQDISSNRKLPLAAFKKGLTYAAVDLSLFFLQSERLKKLMMEITDHLQAEDFQPILISTYPVEKLGEALTFMSRAQHVGKLVLTYE